MLKRYFMIIYAAAALLLFAACKTAPAPPQEQPDGTFLWNGLELIREDVRQTDWGMSHGNVAVPENVLTTKEHKLTVLFRSRSGIYEYGFREFVQVYLDGVWYSSTTELAQNGERLILDHPGRYDGTNDDATAHTVDLSAVGVLPPGRYRLAETFYDDNFKEEIVAFANFWVTEPGAKRPPESETTGKARKEDIVLYAQSLYEARREITDMDIWFCMFAENLSGKEYVVEKEEIVLETKQGGEWQKAGYSHINAGLISGWDTARCEIFLDEPAQAGHYRIRLWAHVFDIPRTTYAGQPGGVELKYEFDIIAYKDAPAPRWDISRLSLSPYDKSSQSPSINMSLTNPVLNKGNTELEITIASNEYHAFGEYYTIEAELDGKWRCVPFASGVFNDIGYSIGFEGRTSAVYPCNPVLACGILPKGRYRIIKEFHLRKYSPEGWGEVISKEFAAAEFTVEETVGSEEFYINSMSGGK